MLKISIVDTPTRCLLMLEGKLIAPWAAELRRACERARADLNGRDLVVEMRHITTISQEGENVILELINEGVKFRSCGVFTKHLLKDLARRAHENLKEAN